MKMIIHGKKYDTETAINRAYFNNGIGCYDSCWFEETLFQKMNGEFFLHGRGGAMSKYFELSGNCLCCQNILQPKRQPFCY